MEKNPLNTPWSLYFDRDGTEDYGIIIDSEENDLVASHLPQSSVPRIANRPFGTGCFWLPEEEGDEMPTLVCQMQLMTAAPKLLDMLKIAIATADPKRHRWGKEAQAAIAEATGQKFNQNEAEAARRMHRAAPRMFAALEACFTMLGHYHAAATGNRTRERIDDVREQVFAALSEARGDTAF